VEWILPLLSEWKIEKETGPARGRNVKKGFGEYVRNSALSVRERKSE
jgi:hypothetical protein